MKLKNVQNSLSSNSLGKIRTPVNLQIISIGQLIKTEQKINTDEQNDNLIAGAINSCQSTAFCFFFRSIMKHFRNIRNAKINMYSIIKSIFCNLISAFCGKGQRFWGFEGHDGVSQI